MVDDKAQLHTLEGVAASVILLLAITYAFNAFVVTPTDDINPGAEVNQKAVNDLLEASEENDDLKKALLNWNETEVGFENSTDGTYYYEGKDPVGVNFGNNTKNLLTERGWSYNIEAEFGKQNGTGTLTVVNNGEPGDSAVRMSQNVVLEDDDEISTGQNLTESETYPIPKSDRAVYNRVEVRVTVW